MKKLILIILIINSNFANSVELDLTKILIKKGVDKALSDMKGLGTDGYARLKYAKIVTKNNNIEIDIKIRATYNDCWKAFKWLGSCIGLPKKSFNIFAKGKLINNEEGNCKIDIYDVHTSNDIVKFIEKLAGPIGDIFGKNLRLEALEGIKNC